MGLARGPDLKNVRSKIGSLDNVKHRPGELSFELIINHISDMIDLDLIN